MFYQKYMIHLKGGTQVEVEEPYDLPWEKSLFTMYEKTKESGAIVARNPVGDSICILKKNISFIRMTHVAKA